MLAKPVKDVTNVASVGNELGNRPRPSAPDVLGAAFDLGQDEYAWRQDGDRACISDW